MKLNWILISIVLFILLSSCNSNVDVVLDYSSTFDKSDSAKKDKKIVIDDKITMTVKADSTIIMKLPTGSHSIQVNGESKKEFYVGNKGGMLNLGNTEYVIYEIEYGSMKRSTEMDDKLNMALKRRMPTQFVIIDSFAVIKKGEGKKYFPDSVIMRAFVQEQTIREGGSDGGFANSYKKVGKNMLFIDKTWDFNITDSIPETITTTSSSTDFYGNAKRTTLMPLRLFLLNAMLNSETFEVRSIHDARNGVNDKKKMKELDKKKMEF